MKYLWKILNSMTKLIVIIFTSISFLYTICKGLFSQSKTTCGVISCLTKTCHFNTCVLCFFLVLWLLDEDVSGGFLSPFPRLLVQNIELNVYLLLRSILFELWRSCGTTLKVRVLF